jgi:hypothetical protein
MENVTTLTQEQILRRILQPKAAERAIASVQKLEEARAKMKDEDRLALLRASLTDKVLAEQVASARITRLETWVAAHNWATGFFDEETLGTDERPVDITVTRSTREVKVWYMSQMRGGTPRRQIWERHATQTYDMIVLDTDDVEYPIMDINRGALKHRDWVDAALQSQMTRKIDTLCKNLLDTTKKASGLRALQNFHSDVVQANIPDANYLDLSAVDTAGKVSVEKLKRILDYCEKWSRDVEDDGQPLQVRTMYMASPNRRDFWDMTDLVAVSGSGLPLSGKDTIPTPARESIWLSGALTQMFGYEFTLMTRNTIPSGYMYISMNKPVGTLWTKPQFTQMLDETTKAQRDRYMECLRMRKVLQMTIREQRIYRYLVVKL